MDILLYTYSLQLSSFYIAAQFFLDRGSQHFAEGSQIQTYEFLESRKNYFTTRQLIRFVSLH